MNIIDLIEKKKAAAELSEKEIKFFIESVTKGLIPDYQISAFLMAVYFTGMTLDETVLFTKYMAESGEILDLSDISDKITDKHSTGGAGDKITLIFLPLMAAAGVYTAKLSGRGLGHTGGTIDKLESIPNFRTDLSVCEFKALVKANGAAIAAQTSSLAPADGILYALRDVTACIDIIPLIASSVVSKKIASGADYIILDVKYGKGAFIKTAEKAQELAEIMVKTGERLNRKISAVITNMNVPLGRAIGNAIEVKEAAEFLRGNIEPDLKEVTYTLAHKAFEKTGRFNNMKDSFKYLDELIYSGKALNKFKEIIEAQSGNASVLEDYSKFPEAAFKYEVKSPETGFVSDIDALLAAKACKISGAGREKKSDKIDYAAGVYLVKKPAEYVKQGETLAVIYTNKQEIIKEAEKMLLDAYVITKEKPAPMQMIYGILN